MKVLAIVYNSPAHLDFGGNGYLNILNSTVNDGGDVDIILSEKPTSKGNSIDIDNLPFRLVNRNLPLYFSGNLEFSDHVVNSILWLTEFLDSNSYDRIYIDRLCTYSQISMQLAGISNYYAVGTESLFWGVKKSISFNRNTLMPRKIRNKKLVQASRYFGLAIKEYNYSFWVWSPHRSIHFLPKIWYQPHLKLKQQSVNIKSKTSKVLLVTYGNSMPLTIVDQILNEIKQVLEFNQSISIRILTGTGKFFEYTTKALAGFSVQVEQWGNYAEEFSNADFVVGHGGTSHIYNCIQFDAIPICFPALADQFYNAERTVELGIGYSFFKYNWWKRLFGAFNKTAFLNRGALKDVLIHEKEYFEKSSALRALKGATSD